VIVQRALAAKSISHAQGGTLLAGFIKILPIYIMVLPGMISRVLFTGKPAASDKRCRPLALWCTMTAVVVALFC